MGSSSSLSMTRVSSESLDSSIAGVSYFVRRNMAYRSDYIVRAKALILSSLPCSEERVRKAAEKLEKNVKGSTQGRLDGFFTVLPKTDAPVKRKVKYKQMGTWKAGEDGLRVNLTDHAHGSKRGAGGRQDAKGQGRQEGQDGDQSEDWDGEGETAEVRRGCPIERTKNEQESFCLFTVCSGTDSFVYVEEGGGEGCVLGCFCAYFLIVVPA